MPDRFRVMTILSICAAAWLAVASVLRRPGGRPAQAEGRSEGVGQGEGVRGQDPADARRVLHQVPRIGEGQGGLDLSTYTDFKSVTEEPEVGRTSSSVQADEMPPKKAKEMPIGRRVELIAWGASSNRARSIAPSWRATAL